jgi:hypothetical protein
VGFWAAVIVAIVGWMLVDEMRTRMTSTTNSKLHHDKPPIGRRVTRPVTLNANSISNSSESDSQVGAIDTVGQPVGAISSLNGALEAFSKKIAMHNKVREATSHLQSTIDLERILTESALKSARRKVESDKLRESLEPSMRESYDANRIKFRNLLKESRGHAEEKKFSYSLPDFKLPSRHNDGVVADAIEIKITELKSERDAYIKEILKKINDETPRSKLSEYFFAEFQRIGGPETSKLIITTPQKTDTARMTLGQLFATVGVAANAFPSTVEGGVKGVEMLDRFAKKAAAEDASREKSRRGSNPGHTGGWFDAGAAGR